MKHSLFALTLGALAAGLSAGLSWGLTSGHAVGLHEEVPKEAPVVYAAEARWFADFDQAVSVAKKEGKDLFVDFTGSDWCGWCIRLHDEVFVHAEWIAAASKDYVFVALDFPDGAEAKANVPNPDRNLELSEKYRVDGFPTVLLMTADGEAYAQTGYEEGGPAAYVAHMNEIAASGKKALAAAKVVVEAFTTAEGDGAKWTAWDAMVAAYKDMDATSPVAVSVAEHVRWAMEADKDNGRGKKAAAVSAFLAKGVLDDEVDAFVTESDPKNKKGMLERVAVIKFDRVRDDSSAMVAVAAIRQLNEVGYKDKAQAFTMNFAAARWCAGPLDDQAGKAEFAAKAMEIGTDDAEMLAALKGIMG